MRVTNVAMVADGNVQFDIAWTHSWRASWKEDGTDWTNWDAAWIFVKYRKEGDPAWSHATLSSKDADHAAPAGAKIDVGRTGNRGTGAFLYRAAEGKGEWSNKGVKLKWLHADDGVADPSKVQLSVHALEMVYVPEGSFYVGSPDKLAGVFVDGSWKKGDPFIPFKVTSEDELEVAQKPGCLYGTGGIGAAHQIGREGKLSAKFPKGYGAFYCMKYELTQGEYVAFLNQLAAAHAVARYPRASFQPKHKDTESHTVTNAPGGYVATVPERSCNWMDWEDSMAHGDWAGLRPMTELEFEKACRGPLQPVTNEYAWGTSTTKDTDIPGLADVPPVPYPVGICGAAERVRSGSTYWGIAAMSGHLRERTISAGHEDGRVFTGACGDGALTDDGMANVDGWPPPSSNWPEQPLVGGWGFRGGPWYGDAAVDTTLHISCRFLASCLRSQRHSTYGWRGVRQAP
jgi:formylglycine-generating enzyme required for sulfatase activity